VEVVDDVPVGEEVVEDVEVDETVYVLCSLDELDALEDAEAVAVEFSCKRRGPVTTLSCCGVIGRRRDGISLFSSSFVIMIEASFVVRILDDDNDNDNLSLNRSVRIAV
jgi:hypothetical protein